MSARRGKVAAVVLAAAVLGTWSDRAALPPGHEVDQLEVCLACHDLEQDIGARVRHAPVVAGECTACHNPHVSRFDALLLERPAPLCTACHEDLKQALTRPVVHQPVADGRCTECHRAHGGEHDGMLLEPAKQLCAGCHSEIEQWDARSHRHPPFVEGSCSACHDPHASDHPGLAAEAGGAACGGCHPVDAGFTQRHSGYPVQQAACQQCHDPHASGRSGLFRTRLHAPFEDGDCTTCHEASDAPAPFALVATQGELCGACHEGEVEASREAAFPHVSAGGGRCTDCHNPHSGDGESLLNTEMRSLCLGCHDPGGASSEESGRFATHADLDCSTCHSPHGGERPLLLTSDSVKLCGECHSHEHGIRHPLGDETRDPRSGQPMTCLSCHGIHDAPHKMYLHGSEERELCIGCHKEIGRS